MRIEILKNRETSLVIDDIGKAICEDGILGEGYSKAISALDRYVKQTESIRGQLKSVKNSDSQVNDILYQSGPNIIAFSGRRGTGKTSAMISFAEFLKKQENGSDLSRDLWKRHYEGMRTLVLSPIDPTMLENDQNILNVVLSRLLYKAEVRWENNAGFYHNLQNLEKEKNDLLRKANACLNGIRAIKTKGDIDSLASLQKIGDSAVLKKNIFDLVDMVVHFCLGDDRGGSRCSYLVIPIDDTDCQIQKAHEVMEDIRRYLTIPNVLILMATDGDMLRTDFAQHYALAFKTGIDRTFLSPDDMEQYAEKYLTKLIPGTHRVYLPVFENVLKENSVTLELGYYDDEKRNLDLISGSCKEGRDRKRAEGNCFDIDFNFQAKVLQFIYQKTGIVFLEHTAYMNNIIPTTMRGLAHLLNFLDSMEKVEEIDFSQVDSQEAFEQEAGKRLRIIEKNLDLFEEYFLNEWIPAKIPGKLAKSLKEIEEQVPENLIQFIYDELREDGKVTGNVTYYDLMDLLGSRNGTVSVLDYVGKRYKHKTDFYHSFAIRTLITIKKNKWAVRIRQRALAAARGKWSGKDIFGMDFTQDDLANLFPDEAGNGNGGYGQWLARLVKVYRKLLLESIEPENKMNSVQRYQMQELAWIVLCNWDVQEIIYKCVNNLIERKKDRPDVGEAVHSAIAARNCGMLESIAKLEAVKISEWPTDFGHVLDNESQKAKGSESTDSVSEVNNLVDNINQMLGNGRGIREDEFLITIDELIRKLTEIGPRSASGEDAEESRKKVDTYRDQGKEIKKAVKAELKAAKEAGIFDSGEPFLKLSEKTVKEITKWTGDISNWLNETAAA